MVVLSYHGLCKYVQSSCNPCEMTNMQSEMQSEMLLWRTAEMLLVFGIKNFSLFRHVYNINNC